MAHGERFISRRGFVGGTAGLGAAVAVAGRLPRVAAQATPGQASPAVEVTDTIQVGIVTSQSGPLQTYGEQYLAGFEIGLAYATGGTGVINGHQIAYEVMDDTGVPDVGVNAAIDLIGQGYTILAGSVVSGVALQIAPLAEQNQILFISGPAATDGLTGINEYTFRSGRQVTQDVLTARSYLETPEGQTAIVFAQDTAFGQSTADAVSAIFGEAGVTVDRILVPQDARDFAPFAQQVLDAGPDLLYVAWAGTTATAMYTALDNQQVLTSTRVVTGLDIRATYPIFGPGAGDISFISHYVYQAPDNEANTFLIDEMETRGGFPDLFMPDGFTAAQMIVHAIEEADGADVDAMIEALEGYEFEGVKGSYTVRAEDHALLQPMFQVNLVTEGTTPEPEVLATLAPEDVAPPEAGS